MTSQLPDAPTTRLTVQCVTQVDALRQVQAAWSRLADTALEPNIFLEPLFLLPALSHLTSNDDISCVLIWSVPKSPSAAEKAKVDGPVLCGLFPVIKGKGLAEKQGLWVHEYAYSGAPLVRADCAKDVLETFLGWVDSQAMSSFRWPHIPVNTALYRELLQLVQRKEQPLYVQKNYLRAEFKPANDTDTYLRRAMSKSTRKELLRMERRLQDSGELTITQLVAHTDSDTNSGTDSKAATQAWIDRFLEIEASGWKGERASALDSATHSKAFFTEMMHGAQQADRLIMLQLALDGRPIAMNIGLQTADGGFYFKIAHRPELRRFMPGRILELAFIRWLHEHPEICWFDSCAMPNHQMIERLWDGRRHMQSFWTGGTSRKSGMKIALLVALSQAKTLLKFGSGKAWIK